MRNARRWLLAAAAVGGSAGPAPAFYWLGWPGAAPSPRPAITTTTDVVDHRPPTGGGTDGPPKPPPEEAPPESPPKGVPEPGTLGLAAVGLGAVAVRWWRKRKK